MNLDMDYGVKIIKYLELNPQPTNCQYTEMGSHFEYVNPNLSTTCIAMRAGTSLMTRHFEINTLLCSVNTTAFLK